MNRIIWSVSIGFFYLCCFFKVSELMRCIDCDNVPSARDCANVKECGPHEVCFSSQIVASTGHIYRTMGCRDSKQCSSGVVGKRNLVIGSQDLIVCDGCCDTEFCQTKLCGDTDYAADRGHFCFHCMNQLPTENCTTMIECGRDSVCYESLHASPSGNLLRETGCYGKLQCAMVEAAINRTASTCWNCCDDDLCNTACDPQKRPTPATAVVTVTSNVSPTHKACVDGTVATVCKLASSVVCQDALHAHNANCSHYCGFC